jgi:uncharacterized protein with PQ loop repeat
MDYWEFNVIGWCGSLLLSFCGLPEMIRTIKTKKCHIGNGMLAMWYIGEIFVFIHVFSGNKDLALLFNYGLNIAILSIMLYYKVRDKLTSK